MNELLPDGTCSFCGNVEKEIPAHHLKPSTVLCGKYIVGNALGEGGFGITYIGRDLTLDIRIAIKEYFPSGYVNRNGELSAEISATTDKQVTFFNKGKDRFLFEARSIAKFNKEQSIVDVRDYFEENGTAYIIMEYLDGENLNVFTRKNGRINPRVLFEKMLPVMRSLDKMHSAGIIHRDISPDNIMCMNNGTLKLMDFGSARYFANEEKNMSVMLKQGYAPEEQYRQNGDQGPWTDVYGLCATIYKCITGVKPEDALDRLHSDNLKRPSQLQIEIDSNLENILMYGLAVYKENRIQSMAQLLAMCENALGYSAPKPFTAPQTTQYKTVPADGNFMHNNRYDYDKGYGDRYSYDTNAPGNKEKKKGNALVAVVVALVVLLFIVVAVMIGFLMHTVDSDEKQKTDETAIETSAHGNLTKDPTKEPTQEPTQPPTEEKKKKGVGLYSDVIEDALEKSDSNSKKARGYLYDLNSDSVKELVMIYDSDEYGNTRCVTSVYSIEDGQVIPVMFEKELYYEPYGKFGCISIVKEDGKILFCTNGEKGSAENSLERTGFWTLYTYDGDYLEIEHDSNYVYYTDGSSIDYGSSLAVLNGEMMSYSNYKKWLDDGLKLVAYLSYDYAGVKDSNGHYEPDSKSLSLKDLLNQVKKAD